MHSLDIKQVIQAPEVMMGPIRLRQPLPIAGLRQISPFLLLHHFDIMVRPDGEGFNVPPHPHRGFMPITFMYEGQVKHKDSLGNEATIKDNEVQWINAGRGLIHSEEAPKEYVRRGGRFHGIQLWINLTAADKMNAPSYQPLTTEQLMLLKGAGTELRLVSGEIGGNVGPAEQRNVTTAMLRMEPASSFEWAIDQENANTVIYVLEGTVETGEGKLLDRFSLAWMEPGKGVIKIVCKEKPASLLLLSGLPIDEPLVSHGPFVMNSETEILEAMRDYEQGKMGFLY